MMLNLGLFKPPQELRELKLLQELEKNPVCSQRELSNKFSIALGVTNACLRRMASKGLIRVKEMDRHRVGYFLTSKGLAEKRNLTRHMISWFLQHYLALKDIIGKKLQEMEIDGVKRVAFYGAGDEMEVAYLAMQTGSLKLAGIVEDPEKLNDRGLFGFDLRDVSQIETLNPDAVLITSLAQQEERIERLKQFIDPKKIRIWNISNLSTVGSL